MNTIKTCSLLLLLLCSVLINAQSFEVALNLQTGISHENIDNAVYNNTTVPTSFAFRGGIEGTYFFNDTWGARLGVNLLTTRYHEVVVIPVLPEEGEEITETSIEKIPIPIYYLSIPVQAVYKLPSKSIAINLMAGMQYNMYLGSKDYALYKAQQYPWYKKGYVSGNLGVEFSKVLNDKLSLSLGLTTDVAFTNFLEENDGIAQLNNKSRLWQVSVPIKLTYHFKK